MVYFKNQLLLITVMFKERKMRGFTLVEISVIVAIMGLLLAIILTGVTAAKNKANNARIEQDFYQIRIEAGKTFALTQSYEGFCDNGVLNPDNSVLAALEEDIRKYNKDQAPVCYNTTDKYCVSAPLYTGQSFCVDYRGYSGTALGTCDSGAVCY